MKKLQILILIMLASNICNARDNADWDLLLPGNEYNVSDRFILSWNNDMFQFTDYYYTNGASFEYVSNQLKVPGIEKFLETPFTLENRMYSLSVVQNMYTPEKVYDSEIQKSDRPYAGYLVAEYKVISENNNKRFTSSLTFGVLGAHSFAGQTQNFVHSMDHLNVPVGWDYQVSNAPVINLSYKHEQKLIDNDVFDIQYGLSARIGSLYTDASGDATIRIGKRNSSFDYTSNNNNRAEAYFFFKGGGSLTYYDATIQGSILSYYPSQHYITNGGRNFFTARYSGGLVLSYKFLRFRGAITRITPEFKGGKSHGWGEVSLGVTF